MICWKSSNSFILGLFNPKCQQEIKRQNNHLKFTLKINLLTNEQIVNESQIKSYFFAFTLENLISGIIFQSWQILGKKSSQDYSQLIFFCCTFYHCHVIFYKQKVISCLCIKEQNWFKIKSFEKVVLIN